jgi:phospholipid/cholesterol/gamma-HCH transport system substrate-binding protein
MDKSRLEIKVGVFVAIGLALLALLVVWFNRGANPWRSTYALRLRTANVGGLKPTSGVLLAGVPVGSVRDLAFDSSGTNVIVTLEIYKSHPIYHDARFVIESANVLGDQYVAVVPTTNSYPLLTNNEVVECEPPFNLQEVARGAAGLVRRLDQTADRLDASVADLRARVLNAQTLGNFGIVMTNMRLFTEDALDAVHDFQGMVSTNRVQVNQAVSNFVLFSAQLDQLGNSASNILATNGENLTAATRNIEQLTGDARSVVKDLQSGKGLAGELLENSTTATNVQLLAENLSLASSNLNRFGLWHFLWAHPPPGTNTVKPVTLEQPPRRQ